MNSVPRPPRGFKYCPHCQEIKLLMDFHRDRNGKFGRVRYCKVCTKQRSYKYSEQIIANAIAWQRNNPERAKEHARNYHKRHPELARRANNLRYQRMGGNRLTDADIDNQFKSQNGLCWWCGKPAGDDWEIDHRIPLSRGGTHTLGNICISCQHCNRSKNNKMPWEWSGRLL